MARRLSGMRPRDALITAALTAQVVWLAIRLQLPGYFQCVVDVGVDACGCRKPVPSGRMLR